ncbi:carboxypeptidase-like regulatory domain-containing protein, partial [Acidobacteria bacterium AH-259-D05]|nr:carboxypeptidase-like regulatory domain-containing protein [Acidobacteria bacterium AH-259-D05]
MGEYAVLKLKILFLAPILALILGLSLAQVGYSSNTSNTSLMGGVRSSDGKPLEGVVVSTRADGKTYTTTVFTDEEGEYFFPPLEKGHYRIWAQAVGFETARTEFKLDAAQKPRQDFTLKTLKDFSKQLSGSEWIASLPEDTPEDRRMKVAFTNNCAGCHQPSFVLQNRFDEAGWREIIGVMETVGIYGNPPRPDRAPFPL